MIGKICIVTFGCLIFLEYEICHTNCVEKRLHLLKRYGILRIEKGKLDNNLPKRFIFYKPSMVQIGGLFISCENLITDSHKSNQHNSVLEKLRVCHHVHPLLSGG